MSPIVENLKLVFTNSTEESIANIAWKNIKMFYMFQTRQVTDVEVIQFEDHNPILVWIGLSLSGLPLTWNALGTVGLLMMPVVSGGFK